MNEENTSATTLLTSAVTDKKLDGLDYSIIVLMFLCIIGVICNKWLQLDAASIIWLEGLVPSCLAALGLKKAVA